MRESPCFVEACVCNTNKQSNNIRLPGKELLSADCHSKHFVGPCSHFWALEGSSPGRLRKLTPRKRLPRGAQRTSALKLQWLGEIILSNSSCFWKETETWEAAGWRPPDVNSRCCLRTQLSRSSCSMGVCFSALLCIAAVFLHIPWYQLVNLRQECPYILFISANLQVTANCWASFLLK